MFEVADVLSEVQQTVAALVEDKGLTLRLPAPRGLQICADRIKLRQVLLNLLSNAIKFTESGGVIEVQVGTEPRGATSAFLCSVRDTGIGIPRDKFKDASIYAVRDAIGHIEDFQRHASPWLSALKLHAATLPLAEFAAVVGNLRGERLGRASAWRTLSVFGGLDELRHTQIPLQLLHELVRWDLQFDWAHAFYHSNDWVAVAAKHLFDELLLGSGAIEFAVATHFVFETGFTNLQFILAGQATANLIQLLREYFKLTPDTWGKDCFGGDYPWLSRPPKAAPGSGGPGGPGVKPGGAP